MDNLNLLIDLHIAADRQGPGGDAETRRAIELSGLSKQRSLKVADIGCGTGASTLVLAREFDAQLIAVDSLSDFLEVLRSRAAQAGLGDRIGTVNASMDTLPFEAGSLDVIWSEGAIYNMGFESGVRQWRRFLKRGGILAISELTWLTASRPAELEAYWGTQYAEVGTASSKLAVLERNGYAPMAYFVLPEHCWLDAYYGPMQQRLPAFPGAAWIERRRQGRGGRGGTGDRSLRAVSGLCRLRVLRRPQDRGRPLRRGRLGTLPLPLLDAEVTTVRSLRVEITESKLWRRPDRSQLPQYEPTLARP